MLDFTKLHLHELLAIAANKARGDMGEGRAFVHFQEMLESAAQFSEAHYNGDGAAMYAAAEVVSTAAVAFDCKVEEPVDAEPDWQAEESRAYEKAAL